MIEMTSSVVSVLAPSNPRFATSRASLVLLLQGYGGEVGRRRVRSVVPLAEAFLVKAVCEGKPLATLAPEGGTARAPHREWPMQHSVLPALLAHQDVHPNRTVHVPPSPIMYGLYLLTFRR